MKRVGTRNIFSFFLLGLMKIIWLIFSAVSGAEMKNLQRLEQAHFLVFFTFKRIDFKLGRNLHMIVLFKQHAPPAFAYF